MKNWLLQKHALFRYCAKGAYRIKSLKPSRSEEFTQPEQKQLWGIMKGTASKNDLFLSPVFGLDPLLLCLKQSACPTINKALVKEGTVPFVTRLFSRAPSIFSVKCAIFSLKILDLFTRWAAAGGICHCLGNLYLGDLLTWAWWYSAMLCWS